MNQSTERWRRFARRRAAARLCQRCNDPVAAGVAQCDACKRLMAERQAERKKRMFKKEDLDLAEKLMTAKDVTLIADLRTMLGSGWVTLATMIDVAVHQQGESKTISMLSDLTSMVVRLGALRSSGETPAG